ncbi:glycosyl transferase [Zhengella mangrovi]|uniref:Glycosyl transferase n=1 Tax=Zhengella mangrovi TaxID=1982044 RepID=A0A2G1QPR0_9HYPH|nr:glycosyltransferase [Zhengella mangrovi]PHP67454.1 glycosyl transferase [Zhengella mangrovi]
MPHDLVVFGEDWGRHPSSTQHLVRRLAGDRNTLWINSLGLRRPRLTRRDATRLATKAVSLLRTPPVPAGRTDRSDHPFRAIIEPRAVSWPGSRVAAAINRRLVGTQVNAALERNGMKAPVLWTSLPTALPLVGTLGERAVVYYAGDDFAALHGVDHGPVAAMERALADRADLILAASPEIAERFDPARTVHLPHGVDFGLFSGPASRNAALPEGKTAGFYGSLNGWIDLPAIADAARRLPGWTFVLIGRIEADLAPIEGLANIRLAPPVSHDSLPSWSQHWTVSLLPFVRNRQIDASNPLKLREYLAAGRPVAATYAFPAIRDLQAPVSTPGTGKTLADAILEAETRTGEARAFVSRLANQGWDARAAHVASLIDAL